MRKTQFNLKNFVSQYKSIFKTAVFLGVAGVVAAPMGAAFADDNTPTLSDTISQDTSFTDLTISSGSQTVKATDASSGSEGKFTVSGNSFKVTGKDTSLTIQGSQPAHSTNYRNELVFDFDTVTVDAGAIVKIEAGKDQQGKGRDSNAQLAGNTIIIGGNEEAGDDDNLKTYVYLGGKNSGSKVSHAILGKETSDITVGGRAAIVIQGPERQAASQILGTNFLINSSNNGITALLVGKGQFGEIYSTNTEIRSGKVSNSGTLAFLGQSVDLTGGSLLNTTGKTLTLGSEDKNLKLTATSGQFSNSGTTNLWGSASFASSTFDNTSGTFNVQSGSSLTIATDDFKAKSGTINLSGSSSSLHVTGATNLTDTAYSGVFTNESGTFNTKISGSGSIGFDDLTLGSKFADANHAVNTGALTVSGTFSVESGANLTTGTLAFATSAQKDISNAVNVSGATLTLGFGNPANQVNLGSANLSASGANSKSGSLTFAGGSWLTSGGLTIGTSGVGTINAGADVTVGTLDVSGSLTVNGTLTVTKKSEDNQSSIKTASGNSVTVGNGGTLVLGTGVFAPKDSTAGNQENTISDKTWTQTGFSGVTVEAGGQLDVDLGKSISLSDATDFKNTFFSGSGLINFVGGVTSDVQADDNGNLSWDKVSGSNGIIVDGFQDKTITGVASNTDVAGAYGNLQLADGEAVQVGGTLQLGQANSNGLLVSQSGGEAVANVTLNNSSASSALTVLASGTIGNVTASGNGQEAILNVGNADTSADLVAGTIGASDKTVSVNVAQGSLTAKSIDAKNFDVAGTVSVTGEGAHINVSDANIEGVVSTTGTLTIGSNSSGTASVNNGGTLISSGVALADGSTLTVGTTAPLVQTRSANARTLSGALDNSKLATNTITFNGTSGSVNVLSGSQMIFGGVTSDNAATEAQFGQLSQLMSTYGASAGLMINADKTNSPSFGVVPADAEAATNGSLVVGTVSSTNLSGGNAYFGSDSLTVINVNGGTSPLANWTANVDHDAKLLISGARLTDEGTSITLVKTVNNTTSVNSDDAQTNTVTQGWTGDNLIVTSGFLKASIDSSSKSLVLSAKTAEEARQTYANLTGDEFALFNYYGVVAREGANNVVNTLLNSGLTYNEQSQAMSSMGRLAQIGGVNQSALSIHGAVADLLSTHLCDDFVEGQKHVWVAPLYVNAQTKDLEAGAYKYGNDLNLGGALIGFETVKSPSARLGLAVNFGTGSADSKGDLYKTDNDLTTFGVHGYGQFEINQFRVITDLGMQYISNDLSQNQFDHQALTADVTARVLTLGATGQYRIQNSVVDVTPHIGARFMTVHTDAYNAQLNGQTVLEANSTNQNLVQIPVGVSASKTLAMNGFTLTPMFDVAVIANLGDTDVDSNVAVTGANAGGLENLAYSTEVLDTVNYGAKIGLQAQKGQIDFALRYSFLGSSTSTNNTVSATLKYAF